MYRLSGFVCITRSLPWTGEHCFNYLHRTSISSDPGKNMKACEDFLYIVLSSHIIVAAEKVEEMSQNLLTVKKVSKLILKKFFQLKIMSIRPVLKITI